MAREAELKDKENPLEENCRKNFELHCGHLSYEVTPQVQKTIEGLMYWVHCENLEESEPQPDVHSLKEAQESIKDMMDCCEKLKVPNWVGNGAIQFARENDLRSHYMSEYFAKSA